MANASSKKTAASRAAAAKTYSVVLGVANGLYMILYAYNHGGFRLPAFYQILIQISLWILQAIAYYWILENAAARKSNDKALVGGAALDFLAFLLFIQFVSLYTTRIYWGLFLLPVWGGHKAYMTFGGMRRVLTGLEGNSAGAPAGGMPTEVDQDLVDRRQKRSERRRQKRL